MTVLHLQTRGGRATRAENHENKYGSLFSGMLCETGVEGDEGRWWCSVDKLMVVVGHCICKREARGGLGVKNHKNECGSSFLGTPCEMGGGGDAVRISWWWWWGGVTNMDLVLPIVC
jgi:hypothetical protein